MREVGRTVLEKIETENPQLAASIRDLMFVFDDILLVDDSMCCRQSIGFALRRAGHQVREASSADAALRELERTREAELEMGTT